MSPASLEDRLSDRPKTVPAADMRLAQFEGSVFAGARHSVYPVTDEGGVVGVLPLRSVGSVPLSRRRLLRVAHRTVPLAETLVLGPDDDLADAAARVSQTHLGRALVLSDGRLVGLLSVTDLAAMLELRAPARTATGLGLGAKRRPAEANR